MNQDRRNQIADEVINSLADGEPIAPPVSLPTEPGYYLDREGKPWGFEDGWWYLLGVEHAFKASEVECFASFAPVTLVPTETWDRLRVLDPEDKRDRMDSSGRVWRVESHGWLHLATDTFGANMPLSELAETVGPLRFADEVSDL